MNYALQSLPETSNVTVLCYHCGSECGDLPIQFDDKKFCCRGCKTVYSLLKENDLCYYYDLKQHAGNTVQNNVVSGFEFLDLETFQQQIIVYKDENISRAEFYVPGMHCLSCIWLLEHLNRLESSILNSRVDFHTKKIFIDFKTGSFSLSGIARLLTTLGYEPYFRKDEGESQNILQRMPLRVRKIAVAGFGFGNIMLLSFPEYLGLTNLSSDDRFFHHLFSGLNIILSLPVIIYSASEFFHNTLSSLKNRYLNIDAPVALALLITFFRSLYEVFWLDGHGYFDSLTGIVFFMLIARYVQEKSSWWAGPGKEIKNYLPLAVVTLDEKGREIMKPVDELKQNDIIRIRHAEVVPTDGVLISDVAWLNLSMLTGESATVTKQKHQNIHAGAKNEGKSIYLKVIRPMKESYFTRLWNSSSSEKKNAIVLDKEFYVTQISRYFTYIVLILSMGGFLFHYFYTDSERAFKVLTTVLIIACPCALLLASGFTSGLALHALRKWGIYFKNEKILDRFAACKTWLIDKTGTLSHRELSEVEFKGKPLSEDDKTRIAILASHSRHPLSKKIFEYFNESYVHNNNIELASYEEFPGQGIRGCFEDGKEINLGSGEFVGVIVQPLIEKGSVVYLKNGSEYAGYFLIKNMWRKNISSWFKRLQSRGIKVRVATGDRPEAIGPVEKSWGVDIQAGLRPDQKVEWVRKEQENGACVCMIGDGLNDVPAFSRADVSVTVNESGNHFLPESDMILDAKYLTSLDYVQMFSRRVRHVILFCFALSLVYNLMGLYFALSAELTPLIAAVLMPASTFSILLSSYLGIYILRQKLKNDIYHDIK